jgi:hypothetical protein
MSVRQSKSLTAQQEHLKDDVLLIARVLVCCRIHDCPQLPNNRNSKAVALLQEQYMYEDC